MTKQMLIRWSPDGTGVVMESDRLMMGTTLAQCLKYTGSKQHGEIDVLPTGMVEHARMRCGGGRDRR